MDTRPYLTVASGKATIYLDERELEAWRLLPPEWRWHVMQLSPTAAYIVLSAPRGGD